jgi:hypothetical protein
VEVAFMEGCIGENFVALRFLSRLFHQQTLLKIIVIAKHY